MLGTLDPLSISPASVPHRFYRVGSKKGKVTKGWIYRELRRKSGEWSPAREL